MLPIKRINSIIAVIGAAAATFEVMMKTFKWYEKRYGKKKTEETISKPIVKGI